MPHLSSGIATGTYTGASGEVGVGLGVGANALFGGSGNTVSLQPFSLQGEVAVNVEVGVSSLGLLYRGTRG
jgi:hypothetical protein